MPLIYQHIINSNTKIGVWHITEAEIFFEEKVSVQRTITHPHKRLQHLAGRYLLKELFPDFPTTLIQIADTNKPYLADEAFHFSISHCGFYAAAIVSTKHRVGVDIEIPHTKVEKIQHKFLTDEEQTLLKTISMPHIQSLTMAWSIKEALFKWFGNGEVDFKSHLHINAFSQNEIGYTSNCSFTKNEPIQLSVQNMLLEGNNLCWVIS
jgi:phosphopantetheinyl transferase